MYNSPPPASAPAATVQSRVKEEQPESSSMTLAAISVSSKLPEFWVEMPRLWFAQFEAVMAPQKQGDEAKFNLVISKLGRDSIQQVSDLVTSPPAENKYKALQERLLQVYEESAERQFQKLVSEMELGSQKPTQLLRRMKDLGRTTQVSELTLKSLWLSRMPPEVRAVIAVCQDQSIDNLSVIADKIIENSRSGEISAISGQSTIAQASSEPIMDLVQQVNTLKLEVAALRNEVQNRGRYGTRSQQGYRSRSGSRPRRTAGDPDWLCRFHYRWKKNARRCEEPCAWRKENKEN
ncbi:hypothetical protein PYW07_010181 [Mythimna separata]|uniref:DUF7041 domain-containing protein n=1 Tax=Mythimna separata TaxID=271217 RepID=A0AAD8DQS1_MYTSE|nr:hypothetical protein PYW07_010181 [Mythimna separata]